jgi:hypothetical protein
MPAHFSITIVPGPSTNDPASFNPPNLPANPGDVISWNNTTARPHLLWETDGDGTPLRVPLGGARWESMQSGDQSPAWTVPPAAGTTIHYRCLRHDGETGTITIKRLRR